MWRRQSFYIVLTCSDILENERHPRFSASGSMWNKALETGTILHIDSMCSTQLVY